MKLKLKKWSKKAAENAKEEQLFLRLFQVNDQIILKVVDRKGNQIKNGNLLKFFPETGGILIMNNINPDIPLKTDLFGAPLTLQETFVDALAKNTGCEEHSLGDLEMKMESLNKLAELFAKLKSKK